MTDSATDTNTTFAAWLSKHAPVLVGLFKFLGYAIFFLIATPLAVAWMILMFLLLCVAAPPVCIIEGLAQLGTSERSWVRVDYYLRDAAAMGVCELPPGLHWSSRLRWRLHRFSSSTLSDDDDMVFVASFFGSLGYIVGVVCLIKALAG